MSSPGTSLDEETRNFFCITLLFHELASKKLRVYFQKQWLSRTGSSWTEKPGGSTLLAMVTKAKGKLFDEQEKLIRSGNTEEWDIALLIKILLNVFVPRPSPEYDALEQLRKIRNEYAHSNNSKISASDFQKMWSTACQALTVLGADPSAAHATVEEEFKAIKDKLQNPMEELIENIKEIAAKTMNSVAVEKMIDKLRRNQHAQHKETLEGQHRIIAKFEEMSMAHDCKQEERVEEIGQKLDGISSAISGVTKKLDENDHRRSEKDERNKDSTRYSVQINDASGFTQVGDNSTMVIGQVDGNHYRRSKKDKANKDSITSNVVINRPRGPLQVGDGSLLIVRGPVGIEDEVQEQNRVDGSEDRQSKEDKANKDSITPNVVINRPRGPLQVGHSTTMLIDQDPVGIEEEDQEQNRDPVGIEEEDQEQSRDPVGIAEEDQEQNRGE